MLPPIPFCHRFLHMPFWTLLHYISHPTPKGRLAFPSNYGRKLASLLPSLGSRVWNIATVKTQANIFSKSWVLMKAFGRVAVVLLNWHQAHSPAPLPYQILICLAGIKSIFWLNEVERRGNDGKLSTLSNQNALQLIRICKAFSEWHPCWVADLLCSDCSRPAAQHQTWKQV